VLLKQKYPEYYLWTNDIFFSTLYQGFEQQLLSSVVQNESRFSVSQQIETLMPEVASIMKGGFDSVASLVKALQTSSREENMRLRKDLAEHMIQFASLITQDDPTTHPAATSSAAVTSSTTLLFPPPRSQEPNAAQEIPRYTLNRNFSTVTDVWREYSVGINGNPSVNSLEERYQTAWRDRKESRFFSSRSVLYREVEKIAANRGISCEEAAYVLEARRIELKMSLDKLMKSIQNTSIP
jgi:Transcriptional activator of glycolytic enzymes